MTLSELINRLPELSKAAGFPVRVTHLERILEVIEIIEADVAVHHTIDSLSSSSGLNRRQLKHYLKLLQESPCSNIFYH